MQAVGMIHISQVVEHVEGKVDVYLVKGVILLSKLANLLFLSGGILGFVQGLGEVSLDLELSGRLQQSMNLFLHLFELLLLSLFFLGLELWGWASLLLAGWLGLEADGSVGFHSGAEAVLGSAHGSHGGCHLSS